MRFILNFFVEEYTISILRLKYNSPFVENCFYSCNRLNSFYIKQRCFGGRLHLHSFMKICSMFLPRNLTSLRILRCILLPSLGIILVFMKPTLIKMYHQLLHNRFLPRKPMSTLHHVPLPSTIRPNSNI